MRKLPLVAASLCLCAVPARSAEVVFGLEGRSLWDSNVLNTVTSQESGFSFLGGPSIRLREPLGDLTYDLYYLPEYQVYTEGKFRNLDDWQQQFTGSAQYRYLENTTFSVQDQFLDQPIGILSFQRATSQ